MRGVSDSSEAGSHDGDSSDEGGLGDDLSEGGRHRSGASQQGNSSNTSVSPIAEIFF
ncbi:hypothetical protein ACP70R_004446 [Stipagrostis hirtigluma subsp. patula]